MNIVVVGHVDHGKSTLVGRLLFDTGSLPKGKVETLEASCRDRGVPFQYSYLIDALREEREKNITVDMARVFFRSQKRDYTILDSPGHTEFLKNMITGAAKAKTAILVVDAREGVMTNTYRHIFLLSFLGAKQIIVAVNKMDLINFDQSRFEKIKTEIESHFSKLGIKSGSFIPVTAFSGGNVVNYDSQMPWYKGKPLLETLDTLAEGSLLDEAPFRLPIQMVFDGYVMGRVVSGQATTSDSFVVWPQGEKVTLEEIAAWPKIENENLSALDNAALKLRAKTSVQRGCVFSRTDQVAPTVSNEITARLFVLSEAPLASESTYQLKIDGQQVNGRIKHISRIIDSSSLAEISERAHLPPLSVVECSWKLEEPIVFDTFDQIPETARFILVSGYHAIAGGIILKVPVSFS